MSRFNVCIETGNAHFYVANPADGPRGVRLVQPEEMFPVVDGQMVANLDGYIVLPRAWFDTDLRLINERLAAENEELQKEAHDDHARYLRLVEAVGNLVNQKGRHNTEIAFKRLQEVYDGLGG